MASYVRLMQLVLLVATTTVIAAVVQPGPDCPTSCGDVTNIQFPFGTNPGCYLDETFLITCNTTYNPPRPYLRNSTIPVLNISLDGKMRVSNRVGRACFNESGVMIANQTRTSFLSLSRFRISNTQNRFTVVGCNALAIIRGSGGQNYSTGCASLCDGTGSLENGTCSGVGCCETAIPGGVTNYRVSFWTLTSNSSVLTFNRCTHAFVVERERYNFSSLDLSDSQMRSRTPVVVDWAVGNSTCQEAVNNASGYACRALHSGCIDSTNGPGYRCNCLPGFEGNAYLFNGCQDIDECRNSSTCGVGYTCTNTPGGHTCSCAEGYEGPSCRRSQASSSTVLIISLSISISLLLLLVGCSWIYWMLQKRKLMKQRQQFFHQNGGFMLKQQLSENQGSACIFTIEDLKKATNNYDESRVIGQGGYGTVYKGLLPDNREIAIKKSKISDQSQIEQFINEVVILSQVSHRNVVKLIGCCLETEVPLLVYEFINNGTLSDHIHDITREPHLSWEMRLKVASEAAGALAYLHSAISTPVIHRDIKSTNILLDDKYTTKVSDFGASKLVPINKSQFTTLVQGTFGYLDPEYFFSGQITEKSDVYSFGVLLAELLTGEEAVSFDRSEDDRNLAMYFVSSVKENRLLEILEDRLVDEGKFEELKEVAMLAQSCLRVKGEERPTMKEVAMELEGLNRIHKHPWVEIDLNDRESEHLLKNKVLSDAYNGFLGGGNDGSTTTGYDSMRDQMMVQLAFR